MKYAIILLIGMLALTGCSESVPIGENYIANVTFIMVVEHEGIEDEYQYNTIWKTQVDCEGKNTILELPEPDFGDVTVYVNSTLTHYIGFEHMQYADCDDYVFTGYQSNLNYYKLK